jgi:DNA-binding winged helix-turn-helix (wHTH) protein/dienelactone hydrolase
VAARGWQQAARVVFAFEGLELDVAAYELRRGPSPVPIEPQAFDVLVYLIRHRERVISKDELMDEVWNGRFVSESAVTSRIKQARRALGDDGQSQRMIRTLHGRGYRFVADVAEREVAGETPDPLTAADGATAAVQYTVSDGLSIAYQVTGSGDLDIVLIPGFVSHLEQDWGDPRHARFLSRLGTVGRLIRFDKRGTGMSDRPAGVPDLETRMHDVLAVLDAVESTRAVLFGYSEGGPMSILCAASHPERVSSLVLYGAYAKRTRAHDYPWAQTPEDRTEYTQHLIRTWDWEADMRMRCPSADDAMTAWWGRRSRAATTPSTLRALMDMNALVDVREALPSVRVRTLVLHRRGDQVVRVEEGRYLADHIPGARFVELEGEDHFVSGNPDQILDPVLAFLSAVSAHPEPAPPAMALAAILAPSANASDMLLQALSTAGGRVRSGPDDRRVVLFDGPATAVRAGLHALEHNAGAALGLHVAEIERDAPRVVGGGVSSALAAADIAPAGTLWTSSTVRDLLAGSGIALEPAGEYELGLAGRQAVFAALVDGSQVSDRSAETMAAMSRVARHPHA